MAAMPHLPEISGDLSEETDVVAMCVTSDRNSRAAVHQKVRYGRRQQTKTSATGKKLISPVGKYVCVKKALCDGNVAEGFILP